MSQQNSYAKCEKDEAGDTDALMLLDTALITSQ